MGEMDLREKNEGSSMSEGIKKFCTDCKTTKTPLWRGGPDGPKFTQNNIAVYDNDDMKPTGRISGFREPLKIRLIALGSEVLLQNLSSSSTWMVKKQRCQRRRKYAEEE